VEELVKVDQFVGMIWFWPLGVEDSDGLMKELNALTMKGGHIGVHNDVCFIFEG